MLSLWRFYGQYTKFYNPGRRRQHYSLSGVKIKKAFDVELEEGKEAVYSIEMTYYGDEYEILFSLELKKGILYVRSVAHKFLELNTNEPEKQI